MDSDWIWLDRSQNRTIISDFTGLDWIWVGCPRCFRYFFITFLETAQDTLADRYSWYHLNIIKRVISLTKTAKQTRRWIWYFYFMRQLFFFLKKSANKIIRSPNFRVVLHYIKIGALKIFPVDFKYFRYLSDNEQ